MKPILILPFFLFANIANAKNYYISQAGSDANNGLTTTTAWKTITKLNASFGIFQSGDSVLFKSGETFYGSIVINKSNIAISSYGIGAKPIITGFTNIKGWTNEGGGIYSKIITSPTQTNMVTLDGLQYGMGRYPDANYLTYENFATNLSITDIGLGTSINWTGAEAAIRKNDWAIDRCTITNHLGDELTYTSKGNDGSGTNNYGYFIQNDLRTVTNYGEWYHNTTNNKIYMYFGTVDPNTKAVKVATLNNLVTNAGFDNVTIKDIEFIGSISTAVSFTNATDNSLISKCNVSFAGHNGIQLAGGSNSSVTYNVVTKCNRIGIISDATSTTIQSNTVTNIGTIAGQTLGADGYNAIYTAGNNALVKYNTIRNTGSTGIVIRGPFTATIQNNFIDSACTVTDDGAGIYTAGQTVARLIDGNIVLNTVGNISGTTRSTSLCVGIFLDEVATNVTVTNNTVANMPAGGIKLHKANNNIITDNTAFNNSYGIDFLNSSGTNVFGNSLRRNIFVAKTSQQFAFRMVSVANNIQGFAIADSNYYTRPINDSLSFIINQPSTGFAYRTLANWKIFSGIDINSKKSNFTTKDVNAIRLEYNETMVAKKITLDAKYIGIDSTIYNGIITLQPFKSAVILKAGMIDAPMKADAGSDILLVLPTNSTILKGTATGTVTGYQWKKVLGPSQFSISTPNSSSTGISNLAAGKYTFQLKITNSSGDSALANVQVVVSSILPVKLIDFTNKAIENKIELKWQTSSEINVSHYTIERSNNGQIFQNIGEVTSNNRINSQSNYSFNDIAPLKGSNFYRLAMVDKDGAVEYSKIIVGSIKSLNGLALSNVSISNINSSIKLLINSNDEKVVNLAVVDVNGRIIITSSVKLQKGFNAIDKSIPTKNKSIYYVKLIDNNQSIARAVLSEF